MNLQSTKKITSSDYLQKPIELETQLYVIVNQIEDMLDDDDKRLILCTCHDKFNEQIQWYIQLYDLHKSIPIQVGDELFLKGTFIDRKLKIQSLGQNLMVCLPQVYISPSELGDISQCERRIIINQQFKNQAYGTHLPILLGIIGHDFYQYLINNESNFIGLMSEIPQLLKWQETQPLPPHFQDQFTDIYQKYIKECYFLNQDYETLLNNSFVMLRKIIIWIHQYIYRQEALFIEKNNIKYTIKFLKLVQVEKNLEQKNFGFKGFLDVVMRVSIQKNNDSVIVCNIPIELKCGKSQKDDYIQQTRIYMMMMQDQDPQDAPIGLLHYILIGDIQLVTISSAQELEYNHFHRNKYVYQRQGQLQKLEILEFPNSYKTCQYCDNVGACAALNMIYQNADPPEQFKKYFEIQSKLKEKSLNYLKDWIHALQLEEKYLRKPKYEFKINKTYISDEILILTMTTNLNQAQYFLDEYDGKKNLVLVKNQTEFKVSILFIKLEPCIQAITEDSQGELYSIYLKIQSNQGKQLQSFESINLKSDLNYTQFHYKGLRSIMVQLVTMDQYERKKDILVFSIEPKFTSPGPEDPRLQALDILNFKLKRLNKDQSNAIKLCLEAEDLALILGFPGTGKTHTIVHLLYLLGYINKRVLICSQNHNAVDNILEKFFSTFPQQDNWIARLGTDCSAFSDISKKYHLDLSTLKSIENIKKVLQEKRLNFSTCHQYKGLIQQEVFDYCIIDEASQMVEPLCIASLLKSTVFILVGDYKQLQPIVMNPNVQEKLGVSLIERLDKNFKCSAKLTLQYRMNKQIMMVANELVYDNQLQLFDIGQMEQLKLREGKTKIERLISAESVMFLNCASQQKELDIVREVVNSLITIGVEKTKIAIIATYNKLIEDIKNNFGNKLEIKIMTIDKSQGIDYECIIVVCSQENENDRHLLENIKRINVACTRAKQKLIIVGNGEYLKKYESLNKLLDILKRQKWVHQME